MKPQNRPVKRLRAERGSEVIHAQLDAESAAILEHCSEFAKQVLGVAPSPSVVLRWALQQLIAEVDETLRHLRIATKQEARSTVHAERTTIEHLARPCFSNAPQALDPKSDFPTWEERMKESVQRGAKDFQAWLLKSLHAPSWKEREFQEFDAVIRRKRHADNKNKGD